jgi:hypothetical protein
MPKKKRIKAAEFEKCISFLTELLPNISTPLAEMVSTCYNAAGNFMPTFLAVNFYMVLEIPFIHE